MGRLITELRNASKPRELDDLSDAAYVVAIESPTNVLVYLDLMGQGRIGKTNTIFMAAKGQVFIMNVRGNSTYFNIETAYLNASPNDLE